MSRNESNLSKISHAVVSLCSDSKRSPADVDNDLEEEQLRSMAVTTTSPAKPATGLGVTLPDLDGDRQVLERARRILQLRPSSPTHSRASSVSSSSSSLRSSSPPYHDPSSFPSSAASISSSSINDAHFPLHGPSSSPPLLSRKNHDGGSKLDGRSSEITNDNDRRRRKYSPGSSGSHSDERKALARLLTVYEDMSARLSDTLLKQSELETNLKIARSNLALAEGHAEALEDKIKRNSMARLSNGGANPRASISSASSSPVPPPLPSLSNMARTGSKSPKLSSGPGAAQSDTDTESMTSPRLGSFWRRRPTVGTASSPNLAQLAETQAAGSGSSSASSSATAAPRAPKTRPPIDKRLSYDESSEGEDTLLRKPSFGMLRSSSANTPLTPADRAHAALVSSLQSQLSLYQASYASLESEHASLQHSHTALDTKYHNLQDEIENLSVSLFEEANTMVAEERKINGFLNRQLDKAKEEVEVLQGELEEFRRSSSVQGPARLSPEQRLSSYRMPLQRRSTSSSVDNLKRSRRRSSVPAIDLLESMVASSPRRASRDMAAAAAAVRALAQRDEEGTVPVPPGSGKRSVSPLNAASFSAPSNPIMQPDQPPGTSVPANLRALMVSVAGTSDAEPPRPRWFSFGARKRTKTENGNGNGGESTSPVSPVPPSSVMPSSSEPSASTSGNTGTNTASAVVQPTRSATLPPPKLPPRKSPEPANSTSVVLESPPKRNGDTAGRALSRARSLSSSSPRPVQISEIPSFLPPLQRPRDPSSARFFSSRSPIIATNNLGSSTTTASSSSGNAGLSPSESRIELAAAPRPDDDPDSSFTFAPASSELATLLDSVTDSSNAASFFGLPNGKAQLPFASAGASASAGAGGGDEGDKTVVQESYPLGLGLGMSTSSSQSERDALPFGTLAPRSATASASASPRKTGGKPDLDGGRNSPFHDPKRSDSSSTFFSAYSSHSNTASPVRSFGAHRPRHHIPAIHTHTTSSPTATAAISASVSASPGPISPSISPFRMPTPPHFKRYPYSSSSSSFRAASSPLDMARSESGKSVGASSSSSSSTSTFLEGRKLERQNSGLSGSGSVVEDLDTLLKSIDAISESLGMEGEEGE
ncbi:MAG: hypothetical protein CYPHOPRED_001466 [Cyphobasidiales sp. Tagirdzhanova-0007]|nr:MAG: hypothetical protein CYPHOPRED_001466 [Cyphobasidiales sp. Tagirdzhanova-0007]